MQIKVNKLRAGLALLQPAVPRKATLPIISHVMVRDGQITATDLETRVSVRLEETSGATLLLPYRAVLDVLKYVPGDEMLTLEASGKKLILSWSDGGATLESKDPRDYPPLDLKNPVAESLLDGDTLVSSLVAAQPYCATETTRPALNGVSLYLGTVLQVAAADGYRLSFQSLNLSYPVQKTIVVPLGTVVILEHLWSKEPAQAGLANDLVSQVTAKRQLKLSLYDANVLEITFGKITLTSKLLAGTPPDHLALLNNFQEPVKVRFIAPDLYQAVRRVQGIASDGTGIVRLQWTDSRMTVSSRSEDIGEIKATIPVESGSNPGRTALYVKYLLDYLEGKDGLITLGKAEGAAPALFHYGARPIVAIMPMQVQWEDEKPAAGESKKESATNEAAEKNPGPEAGKATAGETKDDSEESKPKEIKAAKASPNTPKTGPKKRSSGARKRK